MTKHRRRLQLLGIVVVELVAAAIILRWILTPHSPLPMTRPVEVRDTGQALAAQPSQVSPAEETDVAPPAPAVATVESYEPEPLGIWLEPQIHAALSGAIRDRVTQSSGELAWAGVSAADLIVGWQKRAPSRALAEIVLVPVVPFYSLRDEVSEDELRRAWLGNAPLNGAIPRLLVSAEVAAALDSLYGPRSAAAPVIVVPASQLVDRLWSEAGGVAVVPFDLLEPRLKPLLVDGLSILDRELNLRRYPLRARVWVSGPADWTRVLARDIEERGLSTNRHPDLLTVVTMTGVTALTRGVALRIERNGDSAWPARQLADLLSAADLTHTSNEVSFMPGCQAQSDTMTFCSKPEYLETLQLMGVDLVELTGNHNLDFGASYALLSLDMYAEAGMRTFGGGRNAAEARRPLFITHNGNRLAFLGYNQFGPAYAWATEERPGAARFSAEAVQADLAQVRPQADLVFVNIQHTETYNTVPLANQVADFQAVLGFGADVVTGSQAHQPQAIEFYDGKPIFYGLGNLFFDQTWSAATCQGLLVRHLIYEGRLIASQVLPTVMDRDLQPRLAEAEERDDILQRVFAASGW
jgi:hypothetical protein